MICFYCGKEINLSENEKYQMIPIERPYVNLFFHKENCYNEIKSIEKQYITENAERIWKWVNSNVKNKKIVK